MITRQNYEIYAIDYIENKLSDDLKKEFENFLAQNPDVWEEIQSVKELSLPKENISFPNKDKLKKSPIPELSYFDYLCIGSVENNLNETEKQELATLVNSSAENKAVFLQYKLTKTKPTQTFYPFKQKLKKQPLLTRATYLLKYAAIVFLAITLFNLHNTHVLIQKLNSVALCPLDIYIPDTINRPFYQPKTQTINYTQVASNRRFSSQNNVSNSLDSAKIPIRPINFNLSFQPKPTVQVTPILFKSEPQSKNLKSIMASTINSFKKAARQRGIIISNKEFIITIKNKTYGFCIK